MESAVSICLRDRRRALEIRENAVAQREHNLKLSRDMMLRAKVAKEADNFYALGETTFLFLALGLFVAIFAIMNDICNRDREAYLHCHWRRNALGWEGVRLVTAELLGRCVARGVRDMNVDELVKMPEGGGWVRKLRLLHYHGCDILGLAITFGAVIVSGFGCF
ncbi:hypothetical protein B0A50_08494 [Salinomyces thailandicus]|uniref:Uncharacterized protein n=1 Tax=Salinomyces thailandicus TaxID=706561 RepID=A0A4U0TJQ9_9PEZI|nr:hypothetical protein B0A50_08494 [Salinomyces thailandica]